MTEEKAALLLPKLRFAEFKNSAEWHFEILDKLATPVSEKVGTAVCVPMSITTGVGLVSQIEKFGRDIAGDSYKNYIRLAQNDFAYNKSATKEFPQGYIARFSGTEDAAVPKSIFTCFRPIQELVVPEFLDHLFHGNHHGKWLHKFITVGARAHGSLTVNDGDLMAMPIPLPPNEVEQQKIAECLGSMDDVIEARSQKLEALHQQKNGLMQQLFPQPGETVPRLRFPEFKDAPEWETLSLGSVLTIGSGSDHKSLPDGPYPVYGSGGYMRSVSEYIYDGDSVCIGRKGTIDRPIFLSGRFWTVDTLFYTHSFKGIDPKFAYFVFQLIPWREHNAASGVPSLSKTTIEAIKVACPSDSEQQKISDCLGSLDDLIEALAQNLDILRQQKTGLLQQLFPSLDGNE